MSHLPVTAIDWDREWIPFYTIEFSFENENIIIDHREDIGWYRDSLARFFSENENLLRRSKRKGDIRIFIQFDYFDWTARLKLGGEFPYNGQQTTFYVDASVEDELRRILEINNRRISIHEIDWGALLSDYENHVLGVILERPEGSWGFWPDSEQDKSDMRIIFSLLDENSDLLFEENLTGYFEVNIFFRTFNPETGEEEAHWNSEVVRLYMDRTLNDEISESISRWP